MMERRISTQRLGVPKTKRRDEWRGLTSARAGEIVPVAYFPLLREDSIRGSIGIQVRMEEALHTILNPVRVSARAYLIPKSALARFDGSMELLNRSYMGELAPGGGAAPPWFVKLAPLPQGDKGMPIFDKMGLHYSPVNDELNTDLIESYWQVVNWRRAAVSKALPVEVVTQTDTLAAAFWESWKFDHVKPSFDAAMMEGLVELTPLPGGGERQAGVYGFAEGNAGSTAGLATNAALTTKALSVGPNGGNRIRVEDADGTQAGLFAVYSDTTGGMVSLASIATATKTMRFAQLRQQYQGVPDEYLIDLLMQGIRVPPEDFREPVLLGSSVTTIGQVERYATDGENLDQSVTNGLAQLSIPIATPEINPGGIVLVTVEIVPEQLYERVKDGALDYRGGTAASLPQYIRDELDPQKVEVVENRYADNLHSEPTGIFGYAPLNHQWQRSFARVGGRYKRPVPDAFLEDRQRIWAVEKVDPALSEDFYLCPQPFPHTVFKDAEGDPFEIICVGQMTIRGNTVFGAPFMEDDDHYEKLMAQVDQERIESVPPTGAVVDETVVEDTQDETPN